MFRRKVRQVDDVVAMCLRQNGLETPMLQMRLLDAWETVVGTAIAHYTEEKFIRNQTLFLKVSRPALRSDLAMMRSELVARLNAQVGAHLITDIRFY